MSNNTQINAKNGKTNLPESPSNQFQFPGKKETFQEMIYNSSTGAVLGRTGSQWAKLLLFYTIFYIVLGLLFAICMQGLLLSIPENRPTWVLERSLIGTNPGLGFRPIANNTDFGAVIHYHSQKPMEIKYWTDSIDSFFEVYRNMSQPGNNQKMCDFDSNFESNEVCAVIVDNFGPCTKNQSYGYDRSRPCVFLKLNKIMEWVPEYYDDVNELPIDMPPDLQAYIKSIPAKERRQVWVSCTGHHPSDIEIIGPVEYYPTRGFPGYYYPYRNQPGYLSPVIAVQMSRPKMNQLIHIECRAWAKNIIYDGTLRDRKGSTVFELLID